MASRTAFFSPFSWRSRGGSLRRDRAEQETRRQLDAARPFLQQTAQQLEQQAGQTAQATNRLFRDPRRALQGVGPAFRRRQQEQQNAQVRQMAREFEPPPNVRQRQQSIFRSQMAGRDAREEIDRDRVGRGAETARLFRSRIRNMDDAAGLTGFAQQAQKSRGYLRDKYPDLLPSEALKRELESGSFEAEASLRPGVEFETAQARQRFDPSRPDFSSFRGLTESVVPEPALEAVEENVPYAGGPLRNVIEQSTSPIAIAASAVPILRAGLLTSAAGQVIGGTGGQIAERFGAPGWTSTAGEVIGAVGGPGAAAGITGIVRRGGRPFIRQAARGAVPEVAPQAIDDLLPSERFAQQLDAERVIEDAGTLPAGARTPRVQSEPMDRTVRVGGIEMSVQSHPDFPEVMIDIERTSGRASLSELRQLEQEVGKIVAEHPGRPVRAIVVNPDLAEVLSRRGAVEVSPGGADVASVYDVTPLGRMGAEPPISTAQAASASPSPAPLVDEPFGGVGAARAPTLTQREVEALSARESIPERQSMADYMLSRITPESRPESFAEVAQAQGDRFQGSTFDNIFNLQRRRAGKDTKLIQDTRRVNVLRDIYAHQEGAASTARGMGWLGRHMQTLGIDVEKGVLRNVQMRPGATIPKEWQQNPIDIALHPDDYIFSPEQQQAWDEMQEIFRMSILNEQRHGIDIVPIAGDYWPEAIVKAPAKYEGAIYRPLSHQNMSVSPWFTKERVGLDPRQAHHAGVEYANPFDSMMLRLHGSADAVANRSAIDMLKGMGHKPSEKISKRVTTQLKAAQTEFQEARKAALSARAEEERFRAAIPKESDDVLVRTPAPVEEQIAFTGQARLTSAANARLVEAQQALDVAKSAARGESRRVAQDSPKLFGRVVPRDVYEEFTRYISKEPADAMDEIFRVYRTIMVNGDFGSPMLQNFSLFWNNPKAWLKSVGMGVASIRRAPMEYVAQNEQDIVRAIRLGFISPPTELLLREGGSASQRIGRAPLIKQTQRMFEWNVFVGQLERAKAHMRAGLSDQQLREIADVTRKQAGILFEPGQTAAKAKAMRYLFFAPQYTQALNAIFTDPLLKRGPAQREAIKSMGSMLGGAASAAIGFNYMLNGELPNMDDPEKPGYWGIKLPDGSYVYPFGPLQPTIKMLSEVAINKDPKAIGRYFESKASLPLRWVLAAAEAMGAPLESVRGPAFGRPDEKLSFNKLFEKAKEGDVAGTALQASEQGILPLPIGAGQTIKAVERDAPFGALESFGIRTTLPPSEAAERFKIRQGLDKIDRFKGLTESDRQKITDFENEIESERREWLADPRNAGRDIEPFGKSVEREAPRRLSPELAAWATLSEKGWLANTNPERDQYILDNWEVFSEHYPSLITNRLAALHAQRANTP